MDAKLINACMEQADYLAAKRGLAEKQIEMIQNLFMNDIDILKEAGVNEINARQIALQFARGLYNKKQILIDKAYPGAFESRIEGDLALQNMHEKERAQEFAKSK
eukprot:TRINITY_DN3330_c0_g1_i1.p1 TRINITY_DN3330_c0_g1~~TRINITY_DN3330_c0_g1_i1.p1  ORF type:complete len:105 (+),score=10.09 TRINITY_DN3330_c0_g1_i1:1333-1647(+)